MLPIQPTTYLFSGLKMAQADTSTESLTQEPNQSQRQIRLDDRNATSSYANFCRVTGSPEELIVDFGMNAQPTNNSSQPIEISQRVVMNFFTAKRLLHALHVSVQRHEEVFGPLVTDVQKRVISKEEAK